MLILCYIYYYLFFSVESSGDFPHFVCLIFVDWLKDFESVILN